MPGLWDSIKDVAATAGGAGLGNAVPVFGSGILGGYFGHKAAQGSLGDTGFSRFGQAQDFANQNLDPRLGQLQGNAQRGGYTNQLAHQAGGRQAPNVAESAFRQNQARNIGLMEQLARGQGPSAANAQLQDSLRRNVSAQQALAAGARPGQGAQAQRMASQQASLLGGSLAGQGAVARAQEQLGAINSLTGALQGARGQDLSRGFTNAQNQLSQTNLNDAQQRGMLELNLNNAIAQQEGGLGAQRAKNDLLNAGLGQPTDLESILAVLNGAQQSATSLIPFTKRTSAGGGGAPNTPTSNYGYYNSQAPGSGQPINPYGQ